MNFEDIKTFLIGAGYGLIAIIGIILALAIIIALIIASGYLLGIGLKMAGV